MDCIFFVSVFTTLIFIEVTLRFLGFEPWTYIKRDLNELTTINMTQKLVGYQSKEFIFFLLYRKKTNIKNLLF